MRPMHTSLTTVLLTMSTTVLLEGCRTTTPVEPGDPAAAAPTAKSAESTAGGATTTVPVVMIDQIVSTYVPDGFDPSGRMRIGYNCEIWDEYGYYRGTLPEDQCSAWTVTKQRRSPKTQRLAIADDSSVRIEGGDAGAATMLECKGCPVVEDLAWSPNGDRLAVVREGSPKVEIWSVGEGRRLEELTLSTPGPLTSLELAWPEQLYVLMVTDDGREECDYEEDFDDEECITEWELEGYDDGVAYEFTLLTYSDPEFNEPPTTEPVQATDFYEYISQATLDPRGQCIFIGEFNSSMRDEIDTRVASAPLAGVCPMSEGGAEYSEVEDMLGIDVWRSAEVSWLDGPTPRMLALLSSADWEFDEGSNVELYEFHVQELTPSGGAWVAEIDEVELPLRGSSKAWVEMTKRELVDARATKAGIETAWNHCFDLVTSTDRSDSPSREWCTSSLDLPLRCEFRDMAPEAPAVLARCGRGKGKLTLLSGDDRVDLGVPDGAQWTWGRSWLVTVGDESGTQLLSLNEPDKGQSLGPGSAWVPMTLGPSLDRLLLREDGRVRLLDQTGQELSSVEIHIPPPVRAALSPSGSWLALTDGAKIEVIDLSEGRSTKVWAAPKTGFIAWRQDERALLAGVTASEPNLVWDPTTGARSSKSLPDFPTDSLEPTWQWALLSSNRVMRMMDGLELWFDDSGVLMDSGLFEGEPGALAGVMYRLGDDPLTSPMIAAEHMRAHMERKGLAADFFAGRAIDAGRVQLSEAEFEALVAVAKKDAQVRMEEELQGEED